MRKVVRHLALTAALILGSAVAGWTPAQATYVTWNFQSSSYPSGTIAKNTSCGSPSSYCEKYISGAYDIKATAYYNSGITNTHVSSYTSHNTWTAEALYGKTSSSPKGLGISSGPAPDHGIYGTHFIQIYVGDALAQGLNTFLFSMANADSSMGWSVYGANGSGNGTKLTLLLTGYDDNSHTLTRGYSYYDFFYNGSLSAQDCTVLLASFSGTYVTPVPATLSLFTSGLGVMGLVAWRRKRKLAARASA